MQRFFALGIPLVLAGCGLSSKPLTEAPVAPRTFGAWVISGCTISIKTSEMLLTSSGKLNEQGALDLKATFTPNLTRPPFAQIEGLPIPVGVEGSGRHYTLSVPFNPDVMGRMLSEKPKLRIVYQRLGETSFQEVGIPSIGALEALGAMSPVCP